MHYCLPPRLAKPLATCFITHQSNLPPCDRTRAQLCLAQPVKTLTTCSTALPRQDIFNLLPNLDAVDLSSAMSATTSDQMLVVYLATLLRASIALHNLINNKVNQRERKGTRFAAPVLSLLRLSSPLTLVVQLHLSLELLAMLVSARRRQCHAPASVH